MPKVKARDKRELTPFWSDGQTTYWQGNSVEVLRQLPAGLVHCCVTSPPYWGLRDYGTAQWEGGDAGCNHKATARTPSTWETCGLQRNKKTPVLSAGTVAVNNHAQEPNYRDTCGKCGARRIDRQIGQEPTPDAYVQTMVEVFREVRRVLHDSGTVWLNVGDSYANSGERSNNNGTGKSGLNCLKPGYVPPYHRQDIGAKTKLAIPDGLKPKDLCLIPWRLAIALQADGWWVRSVIVWAKKCLSGGAMLYAKTQNGVAPSTLKDLVRLDPATVQLWDGAKWVQVVAWSKTAPDKASRKERQASRRAMRRLGLNPPPDGELEIELRSGERIGCTANHRWPTVNRGELFAADLKVGDVLQTTRLPEPLVPQSPQMVPDALGWLCGFFLAEGCANNAPTTFAMHADEQGYFLRIQDAARAYGGTARMQQMRGKAAQAQVWCEPLTAILKDYIAGTSCYNKHLSAKCWQRSNAFLENLLDGYLAGDGHARKDTKEWRLGFCNNDALAADLRTLCARLGVSLRLKRTQHQCGDKKFPGWRGSIRFGNDRTQPDAQIVAIRNSRARCYWDIAVAEEPHLFALASGVISHNSCMPESVTDRPTNSWEPIFLLAKSARYFYDAEAVKELAESADRPQPKPEDKTISPNGETPWMNNRYAPGASGYGTGANGTRNQRNVWHLGPEPYAEAHFATFPSEIPRRAILAGTSAVGACVKCGKGWERVIEKPNTTGWRAACGCFGEQFVSTGEMILSDNVAPNTVPCIVLDPFVGAGTTALAARNLGRRCYGIDLSKAYLLGHAIPRLIGDRRPEGIG